MTASNDLKRLEIEISSAHKRVDDVITLVHQEGKEIRHEIIHNHEEVMKRLDSFVDRRKQSSQPQQPDNWRFIVILCGSLAGNVGLIVTLLISMISGNSETLSKHSLANGHQHTTNVIAEHGRSILNNSDGIKSIENKTSKLGVDINQALRERAEISARLEGKSSEINRISSRIDRIEQEVFDRSKYDNLVTFAMLDNRFDGITTTYDSKIDNILDMIKQLQSQPVLQYYQRKVEGLHD